MKRLIKRKAPGLSESYRLRPCSGMLKKYGRFVPVVLGVSLLLCSCSAEGTPTNNDYGESVPLSIQNLYLEGELATRVAPGAVTADGATIAVFLTNAGGYTPIYNRTYTCSGGKWNSTDPVYVDKRTGKALAVYDPNSVVSFGANSTITANTLQAQVYDEAKLWYYDNTNGAGVNNTTPAAFKMKPAYSRMVLQVERDATYLAACKITEVTLTSGGVFFNDLPLDVSTGTLQGSSTAFNATTKPLLTKAEGFVTIPIGTKTIDLILPPQAVQSSGLVLSLKTDSEVRSVTIPYASLPKLESGTQYTVPLKIIGPATLILNGSVTDGGWGTATAIAEITDASGMG